MSRWEQAVRKQLPEPDGKTLFPVVGGVRPQNRIETLSVIVFATLLVLLFAATAWMLVMLLS